MKKYIKSLLFTLFLIILIPCIKANTYLWENSTWEGDLTGIRWGSTAVGDIDNDGDWDLALIGCKGMSDSTCDEYISKIYINNGVNLTENSTWSGNLTQVHYGSIAFGDVDNDGDLDLALTGCSSAGGDASNCNTRNSYIYVNNGTSLVENSSWKGDITDVWKGSIAFGDLNNDGKLDLALTGASGAGSGSDIVKIYINNGINLTENSTWQSSLTAVFISAIAFGDVDNDNDLDLILTGDAGTNDATAEVYINNGTSLVQNSTWSSNLLDVASSAIALGDINNNGNLDLTLIGLASDNHRIYNNTGTSFVQSQQESTHGGNLKVGMYGGSVIFGDYNNDGYLDLAATGNEGYTYIFNNTNGTFTFADAENNLLAVERGSTVLWVDLDKDNDLDFISTGWNAAQGHNAKIYINNITTANTPPNASTSFTASYTNNQLTLTWNNGSDAETPTLGLYYNLRVGNTSGGQNIVSGVYGGGDDNGYFGNMMQRKSITLKNLNLQANQTIYWAVQTIDTGLANGSWSTEQNYTLPADITNPVITLNAPINYFNTTNPVITFNATVYDDTNLTNVSLYGNWSGSLSLNETNSSGANNTAYIFTKNLTYVGDGVYSWLIEAKDKTNNTVNSSTRQFRIDTTYPVISLISPSNASTWTSSSTVTFTYNVTDADIKNCSLIINDVIDQNDSSITVNTAQTFTKTLSNGNYNWSVNCTDFVDYQNNSETWQLTVSYTAPTSESSSSGGGSSGGSGGTSVAGPEDEALWFFASLTPKYHANIYINKPKIAFNKISFIANKQLKMVRFTVKKLEEENISIKIKNKVYQYLRIKTENITDNDLPNASIEFKVIKTWIVDNNIDEDKIVLNRLTDKWNKLDTKKTNTLGKYITYEAVTPSFSYFAITGEKKLNVTIEEKVVIEENVTEEVNISKVEKEEEPILEEVKKEKKSKVWVWFFVVALVVVVITYFYIKRKRGKG